MKLVSNWIIWLCILLIGIIFGKAINSWPLLEFDYKISLIDILSILTTIFLAILISFYFDKYQRHILNEKELVLKRVGDIDELIEGLSLKIEGGSIPLQEAASKVKRITLVFNNILEIIEETKINLESFDKTVFIGKNKSLRDLLTETPTESEDVNETDKSIKVKKGIIKYSDSRIAEIENHFELMKGDLIRFQLKISNSS